MVGKGKQIPAFRFRRIQSGDAGDGGARCPPSRGRQGQKHVGVGLVGWPHERGPACPQETPVPTFVRDTESEE